jgi:hypothetical protein
MGLYQKVGVVNGPAERVFLQTINPVRDHVAQTFGHGVTVLTTPKEARLLIVQATVQDIRYTIHRLSAPSATSGFVLTAGNDPLIIPVEGEDFQFKAFDGTHTAVLQYQWAQ